MFDVSLTFFFNNSSGDRIHCKSYSIKYQDVHQIPYSIIFVSIVNKSFDLGKHKFKE